MFTPRYIQIESVGFEKGNETDAEGLRTQRVTLKRYIDTDTLKRYHRYRQPKI